MALSRHLRASKRNPCRICGQGNEYCINYEDGNTICMKVEQPGCKIVKFKTGEYGYLYVSNENEKREWTPQPVQEKPKPARPMASLDQRHKAYSLLLKNCYFNMSDEHYEHLTVERRLPESELENFGTLPQDKEWRRMLAREISLEVDLKGIPGFFEVIQGVWTVGGPHGILVPFRTPEGKIQGFQVRCDEFTGGGKYRWLSTPPPPEGDFNGGTSSGTYLHFAKFHMDCDVWVTEGGLKAHVASVLSGKPFIGLPGVYLNKPETLEKIKNKFGARFILAPDADIRENIHVYRGWNNTMEAIPTVPLKVALWPPELGKGIDDLLMNTGQLPEHYTQQRFRKMIREDDVKARWEAKQEQKNLSKV